MRTVAILLVSLFLISSCNSGQNSPAVDERLKTELKSYIIKNYLTPEDYILSKFKDHDIVFVGETHYIKHDPGLIQKLIPLLYQKGVFTLGTEFGRREDQPLIDSLLNSSAYDENLARLITFNQFVLWGYKEYIDIYKAAWQLNQFLPQGKRKFRILGLNDSPDWSFVKTQEDKDNGDIKRKVWRGGGENLWAQTILDSVVAKGGKALIYSGIHHAFSEYKQPICDGAKFIRFEDRRMGNFVFQKIGKRAITIFLNGPWYNALGYDQPFVYPADGIIDEVMGEMEPKYQRVGFDTRSTPFGKLTGETSIYRQGYNNFTLEMFCDGYIFQKPFSKYEGVTPIKGFINESNLEKARTQTPDPSFRKAAVEDFYKELSKISDVQKRLPQGK
jgi:hypothetical protein